MNYFEDFRTKNGRGHNINIYHGNDKKPFMVIDKKSLARIIANIGGQELIKIFVHEFEMHDNIDSEAPTINTARAFNALYMKYKNKFYGTGVYRLHKEKSKEFKCFIELAHSLKEIKCTSFEEYLKAQIEGLKFINNGVGGFPTPSQLISSGAFDRYHNYIAQKMDGVTSNLKSSGPTKRMYIPQEEKDLELMQNPKFKKFLQKIRDKKATLQEAWYVQDLMAMRRDGEVPEFINNYVNSLEDGVSNE